MIRVEEDLLMVHKEDFTVRAYEVDTSGKASVASLCNYLQEVAGNHATKLGVAVDELLKKNMTWVLSRLHVQIDRFPRWREKIHIETWPSGRYGKFTTRDFLIFAGKKEAFVRGTSSWMILDLRTLRPITMPDFMTKIAIPKRERAINDEFPKLPLPAVPQIEKLFEVRLSDLDINQHVNNVKYIEWALETIPLEVWHQKRLTSLEISFRAETKYGQRIIVQSEQNENTFLHQVISEKDKRNLTVLRSVWQLN
jgi:medium-chain acyl-[acyl-carrier-protein] hydrolase